MEIRSAVREDVSVIANFIREQAGKENSHTINEEALISDGFGNDALYGCFLCKVEGVPVGCLVHTRTYSTWEGRMMFICGMFTKSTHGLRDKVQEALVRHCAKVAVANDCFRCDLILPRDDTASASWYNQLGAVSLNEWINVWFSRPALTKFISEEAELEKKVKSKYHIRPACIGDVSTILYLIQLLAEFEREPDALKITEKELLRDGFGEDQYYSCLVAVTPLAVTNNCSSPAKSMSKQLSDSMVHDTSIVSLAIYFITYSALEGKVLHLEDLFVQSEYRGQGLGTVMMRECAQVALSRGCCRMQLNVLDWNTKARDLYVHIGGVCRSDLLQIRFTRSTLELLASEQ